MVPLGEMSPYVKAAFIITEDKRFYEHHGIDWFRVFGAIKNNIITFARGPGIFDHHDAAGPEPLARGHQRAGQDPCGASSGKRRSRGEIEREVPEGEDPRALPQPDRSRATAPTGSRRPPSATSASRCATSMSPRPPRSPRSRRRRPATIRAGIPISRPAPQHGHRACCGTTGCSPAEDASAGRRTRSSSRRTRISAASRQYFVEYVRQQLDARSAPISTQSASGSTPRSISTCSRRPSGLSRPGSRRSRAGSTASSPAPDLPAVSRRPRRQPRRRQPHHDARICRALVVDPRRQDRQYPGDGRRTRFRGQQVQPRDAGAAAAGLDLQAHRLRGGVEAGYPLSHVMVDDPLTRRDRDRRGALGAAELRSRVRWADDAARALYMSRNIIAIKLGMELGEEAVISEATQVRHHDARFRPIPRSTSARRT